MTASPSPAPLTDESPGGSKDTSGLPPAWMPPPVTPTFQGGGSGGDGDWKMSDLGPVPERRNRRLWLWIPVGLMSFVLICCVAIFIWSATIGEDTVDRWATEAAVERTEEALSGEGD
jgi:hypothetical protein